MKAKESRFPEVQNKVTMMVNLRGRCGAKDVGNTIDFVVVVCRFDSVLVVTASDFVDVITSEIPPSPPFAIMEEVATGCNSALVVTDCDSTVVSAMGSMVGVGQFVLKKSVVESSHLRVLAQNNSFPSQYINAKVLFPSM